MSEPDKSAIKTAMPSPRSGVALPLGNHPGNTGGKPGRSGRKPAKFYEHCLAAVEDPELWKAAREKQPLGTLGLAAEYTYGKPTQKLEHDGTLQVIVKYDGD